MHCYRHHCCHIGLDECRHDAEIAPHQLVQYIVLTTQQENLNASAHMGLANLYFKLFLGITFSEVL
jgi:hypothetical protein